MTDSGATALFVPTNNGLPKERLCDDLPILARNANIARAKENNVYVIRADVAGQNDMLLSYGSSAIVAPDGIAIESARRLCDQLIVANIETKHTQYNTRDNNTLDRRR